MMLTPTTPAQLIEMDSAALRILIAQAAGVLAHKEGIDHAHAILNKVAHKLARAQ